MSQLDKKNTKIKNKEDQLYFLYIKAENDYFNGYSHYSVHEQMLKDTIRTNAYMTAIMGNPQIFKDKIVLDVGSGTGILSIFAAKSGAKHVYGIQKANIFYQSQQIIKQNELSDKITIIYGLVEQVTLPVEKVDIIISQWMGYFLLYQSMLDSVIFARDKWLKPDGILLPNNARMYIAAINDKNKYTLIYNFWQNVCGVSMKYMQKWVISEPVVDYIDFNEILTDTYQFYNIDLQKVKAQELNFINKFKLKCQKPGQIYGFVTWFDCDFSHGKNKVYLSTSPYAQQTHWKQVLYYLDKPLKIYQEQKLEVQISVCKKKFLPRQLDVEIKCCQNQQNIVKKSYQLI